MNKLSNFNSLSNQTALLAFFSLCVGIISTIIWVSSNNDWKNYLNNSYFSGISIYNSIKYNTKFSNKIKIQKLNIETENISRDYLVKYSGIPSPNIITTVSIFDDKDKLKHKGKISLHIVSSKLKYPLAKIQSFKKYSIEKKLGKVLELVANYCTNPILFIKIDESNWHKIDGNQIWGCLQAPADKRLISILILIISIIIVFFFLRETSAQFSNFINNLKDNLKTSKNVLALIKGPKELKVIKNTLDTFLKLEKNKLEKRLMVLSSISHDLGTPATKLKLRTALIEDKKLREKLETDVDKMIDMMNAVLSYTRSEMNIEEETEISYISLIESIVFDYQDLGKKVSFAKPENKNFGLVSSIFSVNKEYLSFKSNQNHPLLVKAKPISLQRAITNLIDNSLKYGRTATLSLETSSQFIILIVEDEGNDISEELLESLKQPFIRGKNIGYTKGTGLGLTIVSTIAEQHGGSLTFEKSNIGIRAKLLIKR